MDIPNPSQYAIVELAEAIESTNLPIFLDGSNGSNRAVGNRPQIAANTDVDAIKAWLARFLQTKTTFDNYRKEAERLVLWSRITLQKPISSLTHEDMLTYQKFIAAPEPVSQWIMPGRKVARSHPDWRPFAGPLAASSQRQAIIILNTMFSWLVNAGYLAGNPLSLSRQRNRKSSPRVTRYLDDELWAEVKLTIDLMPKETDRQREHYFRLRWLFSLLYLCGLRISEVVNNTMGGFFARRDKSGEERWWLEVTGKGDKTRIIPATNELMVELARYRREKGFSPLPSNTETMPLLIAIGSKQRTMTRGALHLVVKSVFDDTALRLRNQGGEFDHIAAQVELASAHWLRHTAGSHMANNDVDLRHVRDNLGHESISTTNTYLHSTDDIRHAETEGKHKINW
ncbi:tyrosine-type recombinase/integrase [Undibacterium sp. 14-3-2]|uniref:tyrosine-type recombinase/integrase n=1 Tax=Undibacterium sp. 14-3-2 TaxID=2800129 RepID=UPI0019066CAF|nr:tyrosine-type recombinase/integrase [Undibacterium sp. 14-3-2]MBK1891935.1 tyrosine-type recombinase/integrase [Undibacterium sp. 14-3-2]